MNLHLTLTECDAELMLVMMPQGKRKEGELKMKTKEKKKKICGLEPKDNTKKGLCSPSSVTLVLEKTTAASLWRLA